MKQAVRFSDTPSETIQPYIAALSPHHAPDASIISEESIDEKFLSAVKHRKQQAGTTPHMKKTESEKNAEMLKEFLVIGNSTVSQGVATEINFSKLHSILGFSDSPLSTTTGNITPKATRGGSVIDSVDDPSRGDLNQSRNSICSVVTPPSSVEETPDKISHDPRKALVEVISSSPPVASPTAEAIEAPSLSPRQR